MRAKIVFQDGSWFIGRRVSGWEILKSRIPETQGTHHWWVEKSSIGYEIEGIEDTESDRVVYKNKLIGERVAVPISSMKYCVFL